MIGFVRRARPSSRMDAMAVGVLAMCFSGCIADVPSSWSPGEAVFAFTTTRDGNGEVYVATGADTVARNLTRHPSFDGFPSWSPDGRRIAFDSQREGNREIFVMDADGGGPVDISRHAGFDYLPRWSPDGEWIAFVSARDSEYDAAKGNSEAFRGEIYRIRPDGTDLRRLTRDTAHDQSPAWFPDGRRLAWCREAAGDADIWTMDADGGGARVLVATPDYECSPAISPDGRYLAYRVTRGDSATLRIVPVEGGPPATLPTPTRNSWEPAWSPDGGWICFTGEEAGGELRVWAVRSDGTGLRRLTGGTRDQACAWQPRA